MNSVLQSGASICSVAESSSKATASDIGAMMVVSSDVSLMLGLSILWIGMVVSLDRVVCCLRQ